MSSVQDKSVLFVCLGNICRSPAAEAIFLSLCQQSNFSCHIESAGTSAYHVGERPDARMRQALSQRHYSCPSRSQQVKKSDLATFDYILAMDQSNLSNLRRIFAVEADHPKVRLMSEFASPAYQGEDVPDPYYGGQDGFEYVIEMLEDACHGFLDYLQESEKKN